MIALPWPTTFITESLSAGDISPRRAAVSASVSYKIMRMNSRTSLHVRVYQFTCTAR